MDLKLIIKDVDISLSNQSIRTSKYTDYAGGHADVLQIVFNDTFDQWRKWDLAKNDKIRIITDKIDTGDMYTSSINLDFGVYTVRALSTPAKSLNELSGIRENINLIEVLSEISKEIGFELITYNITDYQYLYLERVNLNPFAYLEGILQKEGYLQKIFNNKLIVYSEKILEQMEPLVKVSYEDFIKPPCLNTSDAEILASVENIYQSRDRVIRSKVLSGLNGRNRIFHFPVDSIGEGERFCKNIMRYFNKHEYNGSGTISGSNISAGITIDLNGDFSEWQGKNFVYEVNHDLIYDRQTIKFRKPIKGDY
jgi:hypothetical protein